MLLLKQNLYIMKKIGSVLVLICLVAGSCLGQDDVEAQASLTKIIDDITFSWDIKADELNDYGGFSQFCLDADYRNEVLTLLRDIHHYDSVLYDRLSKAARFSHNHELKKTIQDIEEFEDEYSMRNLVKFLKDECALRKDIEHEADALKNEIGYESYDGKIYLIETQLNKFMKHITKRVDKIRDHVHHLNIN